MTIIDSVILGVIEGLTEFLPISSTGHMVIASHFMKLENTEFLKGYEVIIQFGAILSVLAIYWRKLLAKPHLVRFMFIAFIPTGIVGYFAKSLVDQFLESTILVAWSLILGGVALIWIDRWAQKKSNSQKRDLSQMSVRDALILGFSQCAALVPGVSRSGATIFSGLLLKFTKHEATEFSFLLALPTLGAATLYKLFKIRHALQLENLNLLIVGTIVSFVVAWLAIKGFIKFVEQNGFTPFGIYRIVIGIVVLALAS